MNDIFEKPIKPRTVNENKISNPKLPPSDYTPKIGTIPELVSKNDYRKSLKAIYFNLEQFSPLDKTYGLRKVITVMHNKHSTLVENRQMIHAFNAAFDSFEFTAVAALQDYYGKLDIFNRDKANRDNMRTLYININIMAQLLGVYLGKQSWRTQMTSTTLARYQDDQLKCKRMADRLEYKGRIYIAPKNNELRTNNQNRIIIFNKNQSLNQRQNRFRESSRTRGQRGQRGSRVSQQSRGSRQSRGQRGFYQNKSKDTSANNNLNSNLQQDLKISRDDAMSDPNYTKNSLVINKPEQLKSSRPRSMLELIRSKMSGESQSKYDDIIQKSNQ